MLAFCKYLKHFAGYRLPKSSSIKTVLQYPNTHVQNVNDTDTTLNHAFNALVILPGYVITALV